MNEANPTAARQGKIVWLAMGLMAGLILGGASGWLARAARPELPQRVENPALRSLDACLYVQTSPEYRALCLQTYRLAREALPSRVRQSLANGKAPAVILDLDETVLDNSPFQTWLYEHRTTYSPERWSPWERTKGKEVLAVPGAVAFIAEAEKQGATVFYITNRMEDAREGTIEALEHLGINTQNIHNRLLLKTSTSDKTERRAQVAQTHDVVMLLGDTLTDFDQKFASGKLPEQAEERRKLLADRKAKVDAEAGQWGARWFVLPNPVYGDFSRFEAERALEVMNRSSLPAPEK
jgi:acid phosphatase